MIISFKYRIYPNKRQIDCINNELYEACRLYNSALEHRILAYKGVGKNITYYDQSKELKQLRKDGLCGVTNFTVCQGVLRKLDKTYRSFFNRIKSGQKAGFPRFKPAISYNTITYGSYGDGCKIKNKKIYLQGVGDVNMRLHRPIEGIIKTVSITRKNGKFYVVFSCQVEPNHIEKSGKFIGIDVGIESFAITSNGDFIENIRVYKKSEKRLRVLQRSVARKKKGSNSRKKCVKKVAKQHEKIANKRADFIDKISNKIVVENDIICIENLNIKGLSSGILSKSVHDVGWGIFFSKLKYKAEKAGKEILEVNPNGTSQRCNKCGTIVKKELSERWHNCVVCGESCHRDINSALEILRLGTSLSALRRGNSPNLALEAV